MADCGSLFSMSSYSGMKAPDSAVKAGHSAESLKPAFLRRNHLLACSGMGCFLPPELGAGLERILHLRKQNNKFRREALMITLTPKYRGTKAYFLVWAKLICVAHAKTTISYQHLAPLAGLPTTGNYFGTEIGHLLGEISVDENNAGRSMLSAVAVNAKGAPGDGFFDLARKLGRLNSNAKVDEINFWNNEIFSLYNYWC